MFEPSWWATFFAFVVGGLGGFVVAAMMCAGAKADVAHEEATREIRRRLEVGRRMRDSER